MKEKLFWGTALLTLSGLICRLIGFFYRIFLSHTIGAEGLGIYQLIVPVYHLSYALSTAGIQIALSRLISSAIAKKDHTKALFTFLLATTISFLLSLVMSFLIRFQSPYLANEVLGDSRCLFLLRLLAYTLPFGSLHGCVMGWFMGQKKILLPALSQVFEELIRLAATWLCFMYLLHHHQSITPAIAVTGLLVSEVISVLLSICFIQFEEKQNIFLRKFTFYKSCIQDIINVSFPLTLNRVALNLLHSAEAILIPHSLEKFNLSRAEALESLGIVSGMSLPLIMFPTAVINALSSILLPTISENQALQNTRNIKMLIKKAISYALLLGIGSTLLFSSLGRQLGILFYSSKTAGHYIVRLSSICPFLFCDIVLASILNGLGKTFLCFLINSLNMLLRLGCIYFFVPRIGISGYLIGLIGGELFCSIVSIFIIYTTIFRKQPIDK